MEVKCELSATQATKGKPTLHSANIPGSSSMQSPLQSDRQVGHAHSLLNSIPLEFPKAAVESLHHQPLPVPDPPASASTMLSSGFAEKTKVIQLEASIILVTSKSLQASLPSLPSLYSSQREKGGCFFPCAW